MDIKVKDQIFYRVDSQLAAILTTAFPTVFERFEAKPNTLGVQGDAPLARVTASTETTFGIWRAPLTGKPAIQGKNFRTTMYFEGDPSRASTFNVGGKTPPPEVIEAYRAAFENRSTLEKFQDAGLTNLLTHGPKTEAWDKPETE
jgi:hypothetical protein